MSCSMNQQAGILRSSDTVSHALFMQCIAWLTSAAEVSAPMHVMLLTQQIAAGLPLRVQ